MEFLDQADCRCSRSKPGDLGNSLMMDGWRIMPGVDMRKSKAGRIDTCKKNRHKNSKVNVVNIKAVDPLQDFGRRVRVGGHRPQSSLQAAHQHTSRNPMSAYISIHQSMGSITELKEVKVIAANDLGRTIESSQLHPAYIGHALRQ